MSARSLWVSLLLHGALVVVITRGAGPSPMRHPPATCQVQQLSPSVDTAPATPTPEVRPEAELASEAQVVLPEPPLPESFDDAPPTPRRPVETRELRPQLPLAQWQTALRERAVAKAVVTPEPAVEPAMPTCSTTQAESPQPLPGHNAPPEYPRAARRRGIQGTTVLGITIDDDGAVTACRVVTTSGSTLLDAAALRAAANWRFDRGPALVEVPFVFELRSR